MGKWINKRKFKVIIIYPLFLTKFANKTNKLVHQITHFFNQYFKGIIAPLIPDFKQIKLIIST